MASTNVLPLVSVVIPAYNAESFLRDAVDSVLTQTYAPIQLIVVDDGSSDKTTDILRSYGTALCWLSQVNSGQSTAINRAFSVCCGQLVAYLGADDRLNSNAIEILVRRLASVPEAVLAYPDFCLIDQYGDSIRRISAPDYNQRLLIGKFQCLPGPGALIRKSAWERSGGWSASFRQMPDMDFYFRLSLLGPFLRVPKYLADCRIHSDSTTHKASSYEMAQEPATLVDQFFKRTDLPANVRCWEKECWGSALALSGYLHASAGRISIAMRCFEQSLRAHPTGAFSRGFLVHLLRSLTRVPPYTCFRTMKGAVASAVGISMTRPPKK